MFNGLTSWFSNSVDECRINQWTDNGGLIASFETADYIFSEDATCDDTKEIFETETYLDEHLSVFHPEYISACVREKSRDNIKIGKYFFPPEEVQEYMKREGEVLEWEKGIYNARTDTNRGNQSQKAREDKRQSKDQQRVTLYSQIPQRPTTSKGKASPDKTQTVSKHSEPGKGKDNTDISHLPSKESGQKKQTNNTQNGMSEKKETRNSGKTKENLNETRKTRQNAQNTSTVEHATTSEVNNSLRDDENTGVENNIALENRTRGQHVYYWNDLEVLRLKDLTKVSGTLVAFDTGEDGCELVDLEEE